MQKYNLDNTDDMFEIGRDMAVSQKTSLISNVSDKEKALEHALDSQRLVQGAVPYDLEMKVFITTLGRGFPRAL